MWEWSFLIACSFIHLLWMTTGMYIQVCKTNKIIMSNDINEEIRQLYEQKFLLLNRFLLSHTMRRGEGVTTLGYLCSSVMLCKTLFFLIDISKGIEASAIRFNIEIPIMAKRRSVFWVLLYLLFKFVEDTAYQRRYVTGIVDT